MVSTTQSTAHLVLGTLVPGGLAKDAIIRNSTFTNLNAVAAYSDIVIAGFQGALIENCIFDSNSSGRISGVPVTNFGIPTKSGHILLGIAVSATQAVTASDVTIRGSQFLGAAQTAIFSDTGAGTTPNERITIEDCSITATEVGIQFNNTVASTIENCQIRGVAGNAFAQGVGILLEGQLSYNPTATASCNAILGNTVTNNQEGIIVECGAQGNLLKENNVFNNSNRQIVVKSKKNVLEDNTCFKKPNPPCTTGISRTESNAHYAGVQSTLNEVAA